MILNIPSCLGLVLDISGVLLVYKNGLASALKDATLLMDGISEADRFYNKAVIHLAKLGIQLIFFGFLSVPAKSPFSALRGVRDFAVHINPRTYFDKLNVTRTM